MKNFIREIPEKRNKKKYFYNNTITEIPPTQAPIMWKTQEEKPCQNCDWLEENENIKTIIIPEEIYKVFRKLCKTIKKEWQALLIGTEDSNNVLITDYYIPKQEVTGSSVHNNECIDKKFIEDNSIIGTIHSHGDIAVGFSCTDDRETIYSGQLKYHLNINNKNDLIGLEVITLPCGKKKGVDVIIEREDGEVEIKNLKNIEIKQYNNIYNNYIYGSNKKEKELNNFNYEY